MENLRYAKFALGLLNKTLKGLSIVTHNAISEESASLIMRGILQAMTETYNSYGINNEQLTKEIEDFKAYCFEHYEIKL